MATVHETEQSGARNKSARGGGGRLHLAAERSDERARYMSSRHGVGRLVGKHRQTVKNLVVERLAHSEEV